MSRSTDLPGALQSSYLLCAAPTEAMNGTAGDSCPVLTAVFLSELAPANPLPPPRVCMPQHTHRLQVLRRHLLDAETGKPCVDGVCAQACKSAQDNGKTQDNGKVVNAEEAVGLIQSGAVVTVSIARPALCSTVGQCMHQRCLIP